VVDGVNELDNEDDCQMKKIAVAQIGVGRWGRNILRNLATLPNCDLRWVCDASSSQLQTIQTQYPQLRLTSDPDAVIADPEISAVVIASPAATHFELAKKALMAGKHVFVEKPIVLEVVQLEELTRLADARKLILMEGHLLLYHGAVQKMKSEIDSGSIGKVHHLYFRRTNLGAIRVEANVLWDVGPHDFSVLLFLLNHKMPATVMSTGRHYYLPGIDEVVFTLFQFSDDCIAHFHESWDDPLKERKVMVVGTEGMLLLDEHAQDGKLKRIQKRILDTHHELEHQRFVYEDLGSTVIPYDEAEPLKAEMQHFLNAVTTGTAPLSNPANSRQVLTLLRAAQESLDKKGERVKPGGDLAPGGGTPHPGWWDTSPRWR